jgi:hypothetical protein
LSWCGSGGSGRLNEIGESAGIVAGWFNNFTGAGFDHHDQLLISSSCFNCKANAANERTGLAFSRTQMPFEHQTFGVFHHV